MVLHLKIASKERPKPEDTKKLRQQVEETRKRESEQIDRRPKAS